MPILPSEYCTENEQNSKSHSLEFQNEQQCFKERSNDEILAKYADEYEHSHMTANQDDSAPY
jgi:hypothetical protein